MTVIFSQLLLLSSAYFYFPRKQKTDSLLEKSIRQNIFADLNDTIASNNRSDVPGRIKFKQDLFISDYITINETDTESPSLYFLLAQSRSATPEADPLIIWF